MSLWWRPCLEQLCGFMSSPIKETHLHILLDKVMEGTGGKEKKDIEEGREKRTNMLDVNKELSQQIVRPYINYAEALGDLPTGLNKALVRWGSLRSQGHKTKLLYCCSRTTNTLFLLRPCTLKVSSISDLQWQVQTLTVGTFPFSCLYMSNLHREGDCKFKKCFWLHSQLHALLHFARNLLH